MVTMIEKKPCIENLSTLEGQEVTLMGWVYNHRSSGKISFLQLRDGTGICQCVFAKGECEDTVFEKFEKLRQEGCIQVSGKVRKEKRSPSGFEITGRDLVLLSIPDIPYPISPKEHGIEFLMSHRHLWLRSQRQYSILRIRSSLIQNIHAFFQSHGFVLVSAPILTPNACEGSSTLFNTNYFGEKAFLSQSGQLYMEAAAAAHRRVYCLGPTFRAEKSKTRRHLTEFWMVEPEMAFCELTELMEWIEIFVEFIVQKTLEQSQKELTFLGRDTETLKKIRAPFPRLHYQEAMDILKKEQENFVEGKDLGAADESLLSSHHERPLFVHHYPQKVKAFYMKEDKDPSSSGSGHTGHTGTSHHRPHRHRRRPHRHKPHKPHRHRKRPHRHKPGPHKPYRPHKHKPHRPHRLQPELRSPGPRGLWRNCGGRTARGQRRGFARQVERTPVEQKRIQLVSGFEAIWHLSPCRFWSGN